MILAADASAWIDLSWFAQTAIVALVAAVIGGLISGAVQKEKLRGLSDHLKTHGARLAGLEGRLAQGATDALMHDKRIEVDMARTAMTRDECLRREAAQTDRMVRIFGKIEELQKGQARIEAGFALMAGRVGDGKP